MTEEIEVSLGPDAIGGPKEPCLIGLSGPNRGVLYRLGTGATQVGRAANIVHLVLNETGVSRVHARLECSREGLVKIVDLGSTNGTFVNGERVTETEVADGDTISFGPNALMRLNFQDTVEQKLLRNLYDSATRDELTGLLNMKSFEEHYREFYALCQGGKTKACLAMIDADHFKAVNDSYGHPAGDDVLKELARRILEVTRETDIVARYGGEEFIFLSRDAEIEVAALLMERVRESVESRTFRVRHNNGQQKEISVTVSIGLVPISSERSPEDILSQADAALYAAKDTGRNKVVVAEQ